MSPPSRPTPSESAPVSRPVSTPVSRPVSEPRLAGFQRKHLRKLAHGLKPVVHVGSAGISPPILDALETALTDHELVKVRLHEPEDKKGLARALADQSGAELCGLVGHTAILYRAHPESPRIELPVRG